MKRTDDVVSASEIASWSWCPESWRLSSLGAEPENQEALRRGATHHATTAAFEERSRSTLALGWWLIIAALLLVLAMTFISVRG